MGPLPVLSMGNEHEEASLEEIRRITANRCNCSQGLYRLAQSLEEVSHLVRKELSAIVEERRENKT